MEWVLATLGAALALSLLAALLALYAPLELVAHVRQRGAFSAWGRLRWGWGLLRAEGARRASAWHWAILILGREVPQRHVLSLVRQVKRLLAYFKEEKEPFDWRVLLERERIEIELAALRGAAAQLGGPMQLEELFLRGLVLANGLLRAVGLNPRLALRFRIEDPYWMGMATALGSAAAGLLPPGTLWLEPAWWGPMLEGDAHLEGRLRLGPVGWILLRFWPLSAAGRRLVNAGRTWRSWPREDEPSEDPTCYSEAS